MVVKVDPYITLLLAEFMNVFSDLGWIEEHLIMHLHLPQQPGDLSVGKSHEHHVVHSKQGREDQRGLEQLPADEGRKHVKLSHRRMLSSFESYQGKC